PARPPLSPYTTLFRSRHLALLIGLRLGNVSLRLVPHIVRHGRGTAGDDDRQARYDSKLFHGTSATKFALGGARPCPASANLLSAFNDSIFPAGSRLWASRSQGTILL